MTTETTEWRPPADLLALLVQAEREGKLLQWAGDFDVRFTPAELKARWALGKFRHGAVNWALVDPPLADWKVVRTPTIMDGLVIRFRLKNSPWHNEPEVSASRNGVMVNGGFPLMDQAWIRDLKQLLDIAYQVHRDTEVHGHDAPLSAIPSWLTVEKKTL